MFQDENLIEFSFQARFRMKTPIFTRSGEFKIANRISSFCLKTVDFDPVPVHCTSPGFPDPFPRKEDHRHGNK